VKPFDLLANAVRAKEIAGVLARHGFADLLEQLDLPTGIWTRHPAQPRTHRSNAERIRLALEELGPTFVKFGQLLSMRPDVLPHGLILELSRLQDAVRPVPFEEMGPVLRAELPGEPAEIFSEFDETPVASGSLAQVYFARLRADGRPVAVKLQRPNVARIVQTDLAFAAWVAGQVHQRRPSLQPYDLPAVVEEVRQGVQRELDFRHEARNQQYFNAVNPYAQEVFAPAVVEELTTERLLVMERVEGTPVGRVALPPERARALAAAGARSLVHQVLIAGFFHADPHAGNVLLAADGRLCFLDWGLAGHLTRRLRYALADFWDAAVEQEPERIVNIASLLAPSEARPHLRAMEKEVALALREELNFEGGRQRLGRVMLKLLFIFGRHGIPLSRDYSLMAKAVLSIEQVGRSLDPEFNLRDHTGAVLRDLAKERVSPRKLWRHARDFLRASFAGLEELPGQIHRLVRRLEHDSITFTMQHRGLDRLEQALQTASNRIALGVIIGALIIGSSIIVATHLPPFYHGYPLLGITGYLLSAALGFYVIWDIIRHGRHK
jgi:ubiquinone biosynthesis protein